MRQHRRATVAFESAAEAWTEANRSCQGDKSSDGVNDCGPGEVVEAHSGARPEVAVAAHVGQPTVRSPGPVADDRINETRDANAVQEVADEAGPSDHRTGGDGRAGIGEGELENPNGEERDAGGFISGRGVLQEEPVVADEAVSVCEHKREADGIEENSTKASIHDAFDEDVHRFAGTAEAGFEHGEADLHAEDEERGDECPRGVYRINNIVSLKIRIGRKGMSANEYVNDGHDRQHQRDADAFAGEQSCSVLAPFRTTKALAQAGKLCG